MKYLFLDTNVLLHYENFATIPWQKLIGLSDDVIIVITEIVVGEVDKHKDGNRSKIRERARKISHQLSELFLSGSKLNVPVEYCEFLPPTEEEKSRFDISVSDNRIILSALHSKYKKSDVVIVSADNNLLIKASKCGLGFFKMNDKFRLKGEPSEEEKELKKVKEELSRWTNRISDPKVEFKKDDRGTIIGDTIEFFKPRKRNIESEVGELVRLESERIEEAKEEESLHETRNFLGFQDIMRKTSSQIVAYNEKRKEYLDAYRYQQTGLLASEISKNRFQEIKFRVSNDGNAPTGNMFVHLQFPDDVKLYSKEVSTKCFTFHKPIKPEFDSNLLSALNRSAHDSKEEFEIIDIDYPIHDREFDFQIDSLTHGLCFNINTDIFIDLCVVEQFVIQWVIYDASLIDPVYGELKVVVKCERENKDLCNYLES